VHVRKRIKVFKGLDEVIGFPKLQVVLKLAEVCDGLGSREGPKFVESASSGDETANCYATK
jgi:hypothetical protein